MKLVAAITLSMALHFALLYIPVFQVRMRESLLCLQEEGEPIWGDADEQ
jgi:hypothetical protein